MLQPTLGVLMVSAMFVGALPAQDPAAEPSAEQQALIAKRDEKLKADFMTKADWITDYDKARATAKKANKLIFAYFTRSFAP